MDSARARHHVAVIAALIHSVALAAPAASQQPPPVFELPDVISPGRRPQRRTASPASVSVLTAADLARLGVRTVGDALRFLPEVSVRGFGGPGALQEVSIRGTASAHVLVLIDGVPVNSPAQGLVGLNTIPLDNVEGMAFGPDLGDGRRSLVLVSDNNFAPAQFTQFLLFAFSEK